MRIEPKVTTAAVLLLGLMLLSASVVTVSAASYVVAVHVSCSNLPDAYWVNTFVTITAGGRPYSFSPGFNCGSGYSSSAGGGLLVFGKPSAWKIDLTFHGPPDIGVVFEDTLSGRRFPATVTCEPTSFPLLGASVTISMTVTRTAF